LSQVVSGVYRVLIPETYGNAYVVVRGGRAVIVDTGIPGKAQAILNALQSAGLSPSSVEAIVLTHFHLDHSGSAEELRAATGAKVYVHEATRLTSRASSPRPSRRRRRGRR